MKNLSKEKNVEKPERQTLHCSCGDWLKLEYKSVDQTIEGIHIVSDEMPILVCTTCKKEFQPDWTKGFLRYIVDESKKKGTIEFRGNRKKERSSMRYDFCNEANFKYDANDRKFIPGLESGFAKEGFFTPIFFNRKVLHKYIEFDEYRVEIAGNTYGTIYHDDWDLSFGINRNGKLFVWLGDLDEIPVKEQQYLLSENIESDHDVGSEFYAAQREAEFAELSNENKLLKERLAFEQACNGKFSLKIFQYEKDIYDILEDLVRPVNWNDKGVIHVINCLNKVCVESINKEDLRNEISQLDSDFKTNDLGGMKLLEKWISHIASKLDEKETMKPFFVLYDFRIVLDHEMSPEEEEKKLDYCYERLGINDSRNFEMLYDRLIEELTTSYSELVKTLK